MKLGYARVSTDDQNLDHQREKLHGAGCERVCEKPGHVASRPSMSRVAAMPINLSEVCTLYS